MRPGTLRRVRIATDLVDSEEAWEVFAARFVDANTQPDPPLIVLGQGTSKRAYYGDDIGGTNRAPLLGRVARRFVGALLSFIGVRR